MTTHFGAIVALAAMGEPVVDALLIDNVAVYKAHLDDQLKAPNQRVRTDAAHVKQALLVRSSFFTLLSSISNGFLSFFSR